MPPFVPPLLSSAPPGLRVISPRLAGDAEVVGVGDDLSPDTLIWAYAQGIFPWPIAGYPLLWFCPPHRAVLDFNQIHVPERLSRARRSSPLTFTIDAAFDRVIAECRSSLRPGQPGTWITPPMLAAYQTLHRLGCAHSAEAWDAEGNLVGGLYGVSVGGVFCGESMFHRVSNASKFVLLFLCDYLAARGLTWIDIQVMTPHLKALGAAEIPRAAFLDRLEAERRRGLVLFGAGMINAEETYEMNNKNAAEMSAKDMNAMSGEDITAQMTPEARAEAEQELDTVEPAGSEPFRIGDEGPHTDLDSDPISENGESQRSRR